MKFDTSKIMKAAWQLAKHGKNVFGGKASDYFVSALQITWADKKAAQAKSEAENKAYFAELAAKKNRKNVKDMENVSVTLNRVELDHDSAYGRYYNYIMVDAQGNEYDWITNAGWTAKKIEDKKNVTISYNFKINQRQSDGTVNHKDSTGATVINYVSVK